MALELGQIATQQPNPEQLAQTDPGFAERARGWMQYLQNPDIQAAILQFSASMLNRQGRPTNVIGNSLVDAFGAVGRRQLIDQQQRLTAQQQAAAQQQQQFENQQTERRTGAIEKRADTDLFRALKPPAKKGGGAGTGKADKDAAKRLKELTDTYTEMFSGALGEETDPFAAMASGRLAAKLDAVHGWPPDVVGQLNTRNPFYLRIADLAITAGANPNEVLQAFLRNPDLAAQHFANRLGLIEEDLKIQSPEQESKPTTEKLSPEEEKKRQTVFQEQAPVSP